MLNLLTRSMVIPLETSGHQFMLCCTLINGPVHVHNIISYLVVGIEGGDPG